MRNYCILIGLVAFFLGGASFARAELDYKGSIAVGQEYNDNVNETSHPKADFVTQVIPAIQAEYSASRFLASVDYHGDLRLYDGGQRQNEMRNDLEGKLHFQVIKELLALEATDSNHMVFTNATLGQTRPADSTVDQTNQNISTFSAILTPHFAERTQTELGILSRQELYSGGSGTVDKNIEAAYLNVLHEMTAKLELGGNARVERQFTSQLNFDRYMAALVARYTYKQDCYVYGLFGGVETVPDNASDSLMPLWSAGLTHTFGRTAVILETKGSYEDNPSSAYNSFRALYTATVTHDFDRAKLSLNAGYANYSGTDTQQSGDVTLAGNLEYELTSRLTALVGVSWVNTVASGNNATRTYCTGELRYALPKDFEIRAYYRNKLNDSYSSGNSSYQVNIVGIRLAKTF